MSERKPNMWDGGGFGHSGGVRLEEVQMGGGQRRSRGVLLVFSFL